MPRLITLAIHTLDHAMALRSRLEKEGIDVVFQNVNLEHPVVSSGVRVRIHEHDLPLALRIIENPEVFGHDAVEINDAEATAGRTILVPVDFTDYSYNALCHAVRLAAAHEADITLLHAYLDPAGRRMQLSDRLSFEITDAVARTRLMQKTRDDMTGVIERLRNDMRAGRLPAVKLRWVVEEGVPEDVILQHIKSRPPYMVVMGTRSYERKEREMIGSVSAQVLESARISTVVIPQMRQLPVQAPLKVLMLVNLDQADLLVYDSLQRILKDMPTRTTVVYCPQKRRFIDRNPGLELRRLTHYLRETYPQSDFRALSIDEADARKAVSNRDIYSHYDVVVVAGKKKNLYRRLFNSSVEYQLLFHTDLPLIVIPV